MDETVAVETAKNAAAAVQNSGLGEFIGMNVPPNTASTLAIVFLAMAVILWVLLVLACFMILSLRGQVRRLAAQITESMQHVVKWVEFSGNKNEEIVDQLAEMKKMFEERSSAARKQSQAQAVQIGKLIHQQTDQLTELLRR